MVYRCGTDKVKSIGNKQGVKSKITQIKSRFGCGAFKKANRLILWNYLLVFILLFFCFLTSGYAMDVTLQWTPNTESNLAGYKVFYRQEGQSYDYTTPYWETIVSTCTIYNLDETQTYYFTVRAFSSEGFQSADSSEACLKAGTTTGY